ncbi:methyltransferase [Kutzneria albida]|uniref:Methyltransferase n=1 Tax=Kutzneria albida DSM 43870 TaxID=1449976 RepID=W5WGM7_9PSEU|nr:methyltransferase [Kutzneria albida]AHH99905.1 hypothetical protein KALB_6546 [Kutzneria albida DSM 43870]
MTDPAQDRARLTQTVLGFMAAQTVRAAVRLTLADAFGDATRDHAEVAAELDLPAGTVNRLLRALAALGLFAEPEPGRFALTSTGALLRTDRPDSLHSFVDMFTDPVMIRAWEELPHSVRTGRTSFDELFGEPFFAHLRGHPDKSALFNASMSQGTRALAETLPEVFDASRFHTALDIGGGDGTLLVPLLKANPALRGIVFDSAEGSAQAPDRLAAAGLTERCTVSHGDFFTGLPSGADLYLIKSILHDWDTDRCVTILGHCRSVLPEHGRLLIIEPVLPPTVVPGGPAGLYLSDLNMLVNVGGRERTLADFHELCQRAGFAVEVAEPVPPAGGFWCLVARPV